MDWNPYSIMFGPCLLHISSVTTAVLKPTLVRVRGQVAFLWLPEKKGGIGGGRLFLQDDV